MKKLLLLSLTVLLFSCAGNESENEELEPSGPSFLLLTVEPVWAEGISYNYQNTEQENCSLDDRKYLRISQQGESVFGQEIYSKYHYSLETLELSLDGPSNINPSLIDNFGFNLGPLNQANSQVKVNPKYIKHIELIGFDENDKIFLQEGYMENYYPFNSADSNLNQKIVYFSSNVSEELLNSIVYDKSSVNGFCPTTQKQIFVKKSEEDYINMIIIQIQIQYNDEYNSF